MVSNDDLLKVLQDGFASQDDRFKEINRRLDVTNGRLGKHDDRLDEVEKYQSRLKGAIAVVAIVIAVSAGYISLII